MPAGRTQFTGASGQYFVAHGLSLRDLCATITIGNAPGIDILVSADGGLSTMGIQVKTSRNAYRSSRYGREGYEWDVGANVIGKQSAIFWYAFVDLQATDDGWNPQVYFVPSKWVAEFVQPDFSRYVYFLPMTAVDLCHNKWDNIKKVLEQEESILHFAATWPDDKLVRWGV